MSVHALSRVSLQPGARPRSRVAIDLARGLAAAGVLLSAAVHLDLYAGGFRDIATIGPLFMLNAIAGLAIGLALLCWPHALSTLAAAAFGVATLIAFYLSVTIGLFGWQEFAGGEPQVLAEVADYLAAVFGGLATWMLWRQSRRA